MKIVTLFLLTFLFCTANAQTWQWVKNPRGIGYESGEGIVTDKFGNSYVRGHFDYDSIQFGNNITLYNPNAWLYPQAFFLAKYDAAGNIVWANKIDGHIDAAYHPNGICIDNYQNIYIVSDFDSTLTINTTILTTTSYNDSCFDNLTWTWYPCIKYYNATFIAKYNSNGGLILGKKNSETKKSKIFFYSKSITSATSGKTYINGAFADTLSIYNCAFINFHYYNLKNIFIAQ